MPVSLSQGKQYVSNVVRRVKHDRILDIGPGSGTYAKMFTDAEWTGVEIFEPYIKKYGLHDHYKKLIVADIRDYDLTERFDVAIAGDVLEHMTADEAVAVVEKLKAVADTVIVSIPIGHHPQGECEGNPHEAHVVDDWTDERFRELFQPQKGWVDGCIGVYVWSNQKIVPKICVYTISKNEEMFVERWANSAREADLLLIADTGSTDKTVEIAKQCGIQVHDICITPWRFDHARNASIALIPRDIDVCICMDVDEILEPGWRDEIEKVWTPETTRLSYFFDWGCGIKFKYEKIHARHGYYWHHPCHEYPRFDARIKEVWANTDMLLVSHHPDPTKSRGQYLDLLDLSVKEDPICPRNAFYYARELSFHGRWDDAITALNNYLKLPGATWVNERCYAMRVMGKCYTEKNNFYEAEKWFQQAAAEAPYTREPWCELAMLMYRMQRWPECYAYAMRALGIKDRQLVYTCDPSVWGHWPHDLASISAWYLGLKEVSLEQAQLAADATPSDQRLQANLLWIKEELKKASDPIPNIIHMIYFFGPKSRPFGLVNYLSVKSAYEVQKPDKIYFYYDDEPTNNPYWDDMKQYVEMVKVDAPTEYEGVSLQDWPQYKSDVLRLQKLYELGGIYLDTDCILMKPLNAFRNNDVVMSGHIAGYSKSPGHEVDSMPASTIMAKPKAKFLKIWLDRLADGLKTNVWAWHVVNLPVEIYKERPDLLTLLEMEVFLPFDFNNDAILDPSRAYVANEQIKDAYCLHMWDSVWVDKIKSINEAYVNNVDSVFSLAVRKYLT